MARRIIHNFIKFDQKLQCFFIIQSTKRTISTSNTVNLPPPSDTTTTTNGKSTLTKSNELKAKKSTELSEIRQRSTHLNWFFDPALDKAIDQPLIKLNPMTMMYSGVSEDDSHLLNSSSYLRRELPIRLAHLIKEFRNLPFIVACNPAVLEVHERYIKAFRKFDSFQTEIKDFQGEEKFTELVRETMLMNKDILAMLAEGFRDSRRYIKSEDEVAKYLNKILIARLATRLLCEHHIELHKQSKKNNSDKQDGGSAGSSSSSSSAEGGEGGNMSSSSSSSSSSSDSKSTNHNGTEWVGIINKNFSPKKLVERSSKMVTNLCVNKYGVAPKIKIDGHIGATFPYISLPLEYILPEILKNSFRASVEHSKLVNNASIPDVSVTIGINEKDFVIRIRDRGGGIPHANVPRIFDYHFTTSNENSQETPAGEDSKTNFNMDGLNVISNVTTTHGLSVMHGYGFGLPTSKAYAEYLGGSITFQTLQGIGTDFYLRFALFENASAIVRI